MKFIVVVEASSPFGLAYAELHHPVQVGQQRHVGVVCTEMDVSNPHYMFLRTEPNSLGAVRQAIHLPHGSVLFAIQYAEGEKPQIGFAPPSA